MRSALKLPAILMRGLARRLLLHRRSRPAHGAGTEAALLSDTDLRELVLGVQHARLERGRGRDVLHRHSGDFRSAYLGRGLDFEEARPYQYGDDIRDMDWRTTARAGRPYLKVYREERQQELHLLVDRGPDMRFGTRRQLKAAQAARIAAMLALDAAGANAPISATLWEQGGRVLAALNGLAGARQLIAAAGAPCPPVDATCATHAPEFSGLLRRLHGSLPAGTRLVLISDFGMLSEADLPDLMQCAARHEIRAVQVLDPAERALPDVGRVRFSDMSAGRSALLDSADASLRKTFQQESAALHERQRALFRRAGVHMHRCMTDEDPFASWEAWRHG